MFAVVCWWWFSSHRARLIMANKVKRSKFDGSRRLPKHANRYTGTFTSPTYFFLQRCELLIQQEVELIMHYRFKKDSLFLTSSVLTFVFCDLKWPRIDRLKWKRVCQNVEKIRDVWMRHDGWDLERGPGQKNLLSICFITFNCLLKTLRIFCHLKRAGRNRGSDCEFWNGARDDGLPSAVRSPSAQVFRWAELKSPAPSILQTKRACGDQWKSFTSIMFHRLTKSSGDKRSLLLVAASGWCWDELNLKRHWSEGGHRKLWWRTITSI